MSRAKALGYVTVLVVVTSLLGGPSAHASRSPDPGPPPAGPSLVVVRAKASGHNHFDSSATVDLPAGGTGSVVSPTLPVDMTKATVTVTAPLSDEDGFADVVFALMKEPTPGKKLLACISMTMFSLAANKALAEMTGDLDVYEAVADQLFVAQLEYCMRVAQLVAEYQKNPSARAGAERAGTACGQLPVGIKERVSHSSSGYAVSAAGAPTAKKRSTGVKVTCQLVSGTTRVMTVKPRKRGQTLRQALGGKNLAVTLGSPSNAAAGAAVTVAFKAP
jgi:hypothetical protein